ncbi:hypothetical protein MHYP_G00107290 [Metynnis hypsauchen]
MKAKQGKSRFPFKNTSTGDPYVPLEPLSAGMEWKCLILLRLVLSGDLAFESSMLTEKQEWSSSQGNMVERERASERPSGSQAKRNTALSKCQLIIHCWKTHVGGCCVNFRLRRKE